MATWTQDLTKKDLLEEIALYDKLINGFGEIRRDSEKVEHARLVGIRLELQAALRYKSDINSIVAWNEREEEIHNAT